VSNDRESRLTNLHDFVDGQYTSISAGSISHGQGLYNMILEAERLNGGNARQAVDDLRYVVIGDDLLRPTHGEFRVSPSGRINGSEGFREQFRDDSAQIIHAVSGLYMSFTYGFAGTLAAVGREAQTNLIRWDFELPDYLLYAATDLVYRDVGSFGSSVRAVFGFSPPSLAESVRERILDGVAPYRVECFPASSPITISPTETRPISDIRVGDTVLAFDPAANFGRGALVPRKVVRLYRNTTDEWVKLTWAEGGEQKELIATPGHHFLDRFGNFPTIEEMLQNGRATVVLASGELTEVTTVPRDWRVAA
jgi:hypothetical protein